jgi:ABC-2 type transport system permease protein
VRAVWTIAWREVRSFFVSPVAYVVLTAWLLWCGLSYFQLASWLGMRMSTGGSDNPLSLFFGGTWLFFVPLLLFVPVLTMRLLAEERATGTIEPLLTAPVSERAVVFGKYAAALVFWIVLWIPTLMYVWLTSNYGHVDGGTVLASYLGILGIGVYYMAIGLFMSAVARNQIVAAVLTFMVLGFLFALGLGEYVFVEHQQVFAYISIWGHMDTFSKGIVDSRYLTFDLSLAVLGVFLTVRVLEARRYD